MLKMEHVTKQYDGFSLDCSLEVKRGAITGLVGQNGAGKSTSFKAILGLIRMDGGSISLMGKDVTAFTPKDKEKIGVVLSDSGVSGQLTIRDTAAFLAGFYSQFHSQEFLEECRSFQLPLNKKLKEFSTGMRAKLKLLIAMSHGADFLILDEPTVGLDVVAREEILDILRKFMEEDERRSILISSHISSDLEGLCDDLYMIHEGKILLHEETDRLLENYAILKVGEDQFRELEKEYLLRKKKETFGYCCLTDQKQFYAENYPKIVIQNGNIDEVISMMIRGEKI